MNGGDEAAHLKNRFGVFPGVLFAQQGHLKGLPESQVSCSACFCQNSNSWARSRVIRIPIFGRAYLGGGSSQSLSWHSECFEGAQRSGALTLPLYHLILVAGVSREDFWGVRWLVIAQRKQQQQVWLQQWLHTGVVVVLDLQVYSWVLVSNSKIRWQSAAFLSLCRCFVFSR